MKQARDPFFPDAVKSLYRAIDEGINRKLAIDVGFTSLLRTAPYEMPGGMIDGFRRRHIAIKRFQERTLELFKASLREDCDPEIALTVLGDVAEHHGVTFHRRLTDQQHRTPVFFRTDEPVPGKLTEIQCPGSGWCMAEEIRSLYRGREDLFGVPRHFQEPLAAVFSKVLMEHVGRVPVVHYLMDNASRPHGARYFLQRTREHGVKYFSYDKDVVPKDCNFIRSHDFITLPHHNFFQERMERCNHGEVLFDLPPSVLFDCKAILAWPFWHKTRGSYDDEIRSLFPHTSLIQTEGFELSDGTQIKPEAFCALPAGERKYYLKYAGSDIAKNWGSKAVFLANTLTAAQCRSLVQDILAETRQGRRWVLQEAVSQREGVSTFGRDGSCVDVMAYAKFSGFYGPTGLMGILVMHKPFHKVHGSPDTIVSIVY